MSAAIIIASWAKNSRETLMVKLDTFKDQPIVDCRAWYAGADGTLKPGRGGLTVSIRHLPELAEATAKALATAKATGLLTENGSLNE
jgi:Transcriptional Coactivator p15 (PC4)